jgi:hypothetical protein
MDDTVYRTTWREALAYLLAYALWIVLSAATGLALLMLRSAVSPLMTVLLARNTYYQMHVVELGGTVNSIDRLFLIVFAIIWLVFMLWMEEYFRTSIVKARERRARAALAEDGKPVAETALQRWSLDLLLRRAAVVALFPLGVLVLLLLMRGLVLLLV